MVHGDAIPVFLLLVHGSRRRPAGRLACPRIGYATFQPPAVCRKPSALQHYGPHRPLAHTRKYTLGMTLAKVPSRSQRLPGTRPDRKGLGREPACRTKGPLPARLQVSAARSGAPSPCCRGDATKAADEGLRPADSDTSGRKGRSGDSVAMPTQPRPPLIGPRSRVSTGPRGNGLEPSSVSSPRSELRTDTSTQLSYSMPGPEASLNRQSVPSDPRSVAGD